MTVKLYLTPEVEARLAAQAHAHGLTLEAYLDQVLQNTVTSKSPERARDVSRTQAEAIQRARELAGGREIQKRPAGKKSLAQLFADSPFKGLDLKFERDPDTGRPVSL